MVVSLDPEMQDIKGKEMKFSINQKRKNKDKNLVQTEKQEDEKVDLEEQIGELTIVVL